MQPPLTHLVDTLIDSCPEGILVLSPDGRPSRVNRSLSAMLLREQAELLDSPFAALFANDLDHRKVVELLQRDEGVRNVELRLRRGDGTLCWTRLTLETTQGDGGPAVVWVQDLTAQKAIAEAAAQGERTLLDVLDESPVAVGISDTQGKFLFWNARFFGMGLQIKDAHGNPSFGLVFEHPEQQAALLARLAEDNSVKDAEARIVLPKDRRAWVLISMRNMEFEGRKAVLTWVYDITAQKLQAEAVAAAHQEAEVANRAKSDFLATMSHEIRTPMNGVLTMAEMLDQTSLADDQKGMTAVIRDSATALLTIIDDILDFSKIEAGRLALEKVSFSVSTVVEGVADLLAMRAVERDLDLSVYVDPRTPDHLEGDPHRLRQVLLNLIGNAIKFTEKGGVSVEVAADPVPGGRAALTFRVADSGIGIPEDKLPLLFQPFSQADTSTVRRFGGTGLGLSISRALVTLMGGEIGVESSPGAGSRFWFRVALPVRDERRSLMDFDLSGLRFAFLGADGPCLRAVTQYIGILGGEVTLFGSCDDLHADLRRPRRDPPVRVVVADLDVREHDLAQVAAGLAGCRGAAEGPRVVGLIPRALQALSPTFVDGLDIPIVGKPLKRQEFCHAVALAAGRAEEKLKTVNPCRRGEEDNNGCLKFVPPPVEEAAAAGVLILVAEDNRTNQTVMRMLFERMGYAAEIVENGAEALVALQGGRYGLLVTDCHMPVMDGYQLATSVREAEAGCAGARRLPIVALTADVLAGTAQRCRDAGMDAYLKKPVERPALEAAIQQWLPEAAEFRRYENAPRPVAQQRPEPAAPADPVLDTGPLLELMGGDESILGPMLQDFIETTRPIVEGLVTALGSGDLESARKQAHSAAGAAKTAGAMEFAAACAAVEQAAAAGDGDAAAGFKTTVSESFLRAEQAVAVL